MRTESREAASARGDLSYGCPLCVAPQAHPLLSHGTAATAFVVFVHDCRCVVVHGAAASAQTRVSRHQLRLSPKGKRWRGGGGCCGKGLARPRIYGKVFVNASWSRLEQPLVCVCCSVCRVQRLGVYSSSSSQPSRHSTSCNAYRFQRNKCLRGACGVCTLSSGSNKKSARGLLLVGRGPP